MRSLGHIDVLIVGAGLSGIAAAVRLGRDRPQRSLAIWEARDALGGTWDLFRYPGVRSDSDMYTLGFPFKPWRDAHPIASGGVILDYLRETATENGLDTLITYGRRVTSVAWSSADAMWAVTADDLHSGEIVEITCGFLVICSGYYRYDAGYTPELPGLADFSGQVIHPQHWPADFAAHGRRIVVIGSGATAVTLVPALADEGARVTMLQRSPTFIATIPSTDRAVARLRRWLPDRVADRAVRALAVARSVLIYRFAQRAPGRMRHFLRAGAERQLPADFDFDTHLSPAYDPWDERLCAAPDGDFFRALRTQGAEIVTDRIARITGTGIRLDSGRELEADVIITATGLSLQILGGIRVEVDGAVVDPADTITYRGAMLSGIPNAVVAIGYTNASWTLKIDLIMDFTARLLDRMTRSGATTVVARVPDARRGTRPLFDMRSGYLRRGSHLMPKQGLSAPWVAPQNYYRDRRLMRRSVRDGLHFSGAR